MLALGRTENSSHKSSTSTQCVAASTSADCDSVCEAGSYFYNYTIHDQVLGHEGTWSNRVKRTMSLTSTWTTPGGSMWSRRCSGCRIAVSAGNPGADDCCDAMLILD